MSEFRVALFSDPPFGTWAIPELARAGVGLSTVISVVPRVTRVDAGDEQKQIAEKHGAAFLRPASLSSPEFVEAFRKTNTSAIAAMSFLNKIPNEILSMATHGGVNAHPALLPRYRGAIPYFWILYRREKKTGVTVHAMNDVFDSGDIHYQEEFPIAEDDTTGILAIKCCAIGIRLLIKALTELKAGRPLPRTPQNDKNATYAPIPDGTVLEIDWRKPAEEILALIRAAAPFLGAYTTFRNFQLKIWSARFSRPNAEKVRPGTLIVSKGRAEVAAADQFISLEAMQMDMLRFYSGAEFISIPNLKDGEMLGSAR